MADSEWAKLKALGGAAWLRRFLGAKPDGYYDVFQRRDADYAPDAPVNRVREIND